MITTTMKDIILKINSDIQEDFNNTLAEYMDTLLDEGGDIDPDKYLDFVNDFASLRGLEIYGYPNFNVNDLYNTNGMNFVFILSDIRLHLRCIYGINATIQS